MPLSSGLYLVATPIGNLGDITFRALEILKRADVILCEDTRTSGKLLSRYGVKTKRIAYHEHNAAKMRPEIMERLGKGQGLALISDAGTPLINDPGYKLVRDCKAEGFNVTAAPGASSPIVALILSGLPSDHFFYAGFLPPKTMARQKELTRFTAIPGSLIFLESPKRLAASLADMARVLGGSREAAVTRELTKMFEEVRNGTLDELATHYEEAGAPKGEIVIIVGPANDADNEPSPEDIDARLLDLIKTHRTKDAADILARETGLKKRDLYNRALELAKTE
ncbi:MULTISPECIES: 16S rRNA (cytidine(1402)-2'-O)-methyltransferase [Thalassospira]|uniref:16S rRNA (cytidine(1402)-2'-O)-methyltransferase n=1 Tax=Thalassospira TaxID=168934 RepID=UPI0014792FA5|nr:MULTISPECIES: 16S rRNA (cytidine(1402)-2'-O)-methyltransferase [Thalassospira]URK16765.1 16S rRNA (cytidine(1402)-2'-O)-methyltransferase [Thalassospira sp. GO-4]